MPDFLQTCLIVCPFVFMAGFVDSVAGGGGLISLPAYLFVGLPIHVASGTNKVVNCVGTAVAAGNYIKSGNVQLRDALLSSATALVGAAVCTDIAVYLSDQVLNVIILCALPAVAILLTVKKDFGVSSTIKENMTARKEALLCMLIGFVIGCYDGLIGPGTGTFLTMAFTLFIGMDLLRASGCAKISNLSSNIASAIVWLGNDCVMYALVPPAIISSVLGNYLGARYAIRGGSKRIRGMIFVVLALLFLKLLFELIP